jgi:DNA-directed RNA polymerase subunit RPC12/RpoP
VSSAVVIACVGCGASLPVDVDTASVTCRYCGASQAVPVAVREQARAWRDAIAAEHRQESTSAQVAELHQVAARSNAATLVGVLIFACTVPWWIMALAAGLALPWWGWALAVAITGSSFFTIVRFFWRLTRRRHVALSLGELELPCGRCAAQVAIPEGATVVTCESCGAAVVVPAGAHEAHHQRAHGRALDAAAEREAAERANRESLATANKIIDWLSHGPMGFAPFFVVAMLVCAVILAAFLFPLGQTAAGLVTMGVCGGLAAVGLVHGLLHWGNESLWRALSRRVSERSRPSLERVQRALGIVPLLAIDCLIGFSLLGLAVYLSNPDGPTNFDAAVIMVAVGIGFAMLGFAIAALRALPALLLWLWRAVCGR